MAKRLIHLSNDNDNIMIKQELEYYRLQLK